MAQGTSLPFGIRDIKILPYPTQAATTLGTTAIDLPNAQTMTFSEKEEYTKLRGDDKDVASHGSGASVEWDIESGGISIEAFKAINGGEIVETGVTPNQVKRYRKKSNSDRPYFIALGQAISDSGGDFHTVVWLCKADRDVKWELKDGEFMVPAMSGTGYPCRVVGQVGDLDLLDAIYDFLQNETATALIAPTLDA